MSALFDHRRDRCSDPERNETHAFTAWECVTGCGIGSTIRSRRDVEQLVADRLAVFARGIADALGTPSAGGGINVAASIS